VAATKDLLGQAVGFYGRCLCRSRAAAAAAVLTTCAPWRVECGPCLAQSRRLVGRSRPRCAELAHLLADTRCDFLGRGINYPIATGWGPQTQGISYIHRGVTSREMKQRTDRPARFLGCRWCPIAMPGSRLRQGASPMPGGQARDAQLSVAGARTLTPELFSMSCVRCLRLRAALALLNGDSECRCSSYHIAAHRGPLMSISRATLAKSVTVSDRLPCPRSF